MAEIDLFSPTSANFLAQKRFFTEFLDLDDDDSVYKRKIVSMLEAGSTRLIVNLDDMRKFNRETTESFMTRPMEYIAPWQAALRDFIKALDIDGPVKTDLDEEFHIGIEGNFGSHRVDPRMLKASHVGMLMCLEGIVIRSSVVRPKVSKTVHYCPATDKHNSQTYHDATSLTGFPTGSAYPTKDDADNPLETEFGLSTYTDYQTLAIQEMPERAPPGLLPKSVDVVVNSEDLVDLCKPGDRIQCIGIYRALAGAGAAEHSGHFRAVVIATNIRHLAKDGNSTKSQAELTEQDIRNIRAISKRKDVFELLSMSIAPSIYGFPHIKKALLLLLVGGVERNLDNGTHIRGDINLLMVGDPSTAKSQLLRFVLHIAPLAINTTGKGSSGVGLTAAVLQDKDTGERKLEAGAMVLADRGVVCIDEFDKMGDNDRVAIHEVMEQQTVTIAKAGIHMSLNARCSVVAAANPTYGQYNRDEPPSKNVDMPDSLISRFDLLFIVLDQPDPEIDREIATKVLNNHRYISKRTVAEEDNATDNVEETVVFEKFDKLLHASTQKLQRGRGKKTAEFCTIAFLKKYIKFAKDSYTPKLTLAASEMIGHAYKEIRNRSAGERSMPITARALETLIRLSSAHAKCRLSKTVSEKDVEAAVALLRFALENDVNPPEDDEAEDEAKADGDGDSMDDDDDDNQGRDVYARQENERKRDEFDLPEEDDDDEEQASSQPRRKRKNSTPARTASASKQSRTPSQTTPSRQPRASPGASASNARMKEFMKRFISLCNTRRLEMMKLEDLLEGVNAEASEPFTAEEAEVLLQKLEEANKVMYRRGEVRRV
mmetsp:Transcript_12674/g.18179  ORF Transcript_12674/g.18179 Transcript_12674/m.18179 type:complete len:827 (-) Transcript_12674:89-2569(-)|eukprot:CAMPEP_0175097182 /NCGR_PEP_ID=MMETSP0086_2-20121207/5146_1 /TAXON_ID=136419 /ORGANISM="Unknown Unknown, Strain D1" /LENGTH=826 /DNA_ID=CAMNT_0016370667 /DNA_START=41 /DNA_END=2521 /DNA_ORIENTATION=-